MISKIKCIISIVLIAMVVCTACGEEKAVKTESRIENPSKSLNQKKPTEKLLPLPKEIGYTESLIMYGQTQEGMPLIYTIGQQKEGQYYYNKYVYGTDWTKEEAEFQKIIKKKNKNMLIQRIFCNGEKIYLVNVTILPGKEKEYNLSLYQYDKEKPELVKIDINDMVYEDKDTKVKYALADMQFNKNDFVLGYNSGKFYLYNEKKKKRVDYTQKLYGNYKVFDGKLYTSEISKKKIIGLDLESKEVTEQFELDLQQTGYNFCTDDEELFVACKNGVYRLENEKAEQIVSGDIFTPYVLDDAANIVALNKKGNTFYILFSRDNAYEFYSYTVD